MNIKKISLLVLLSMLLPGTMIYSAAGEEKEADRSDRHKRQRLGNDRSDDEDNNDLKRKFEGGESGNSKKRALSFQDEVITLFKNSYTPLRDGFGLLGLDYAAFLETQRYLIPQDADAEMRIDDREFMHEIVVAAEDIIIKGMQVRLREAFLAALHEKRGLDSHSLKILNFAQNYQHVFGLDILNGLSQFLQTTNFIQRAVSENNIEIVTLLLSMNENYVNLKDKQDTTLLMIAAEKGYIEMVNMLIAAGADVNARDKGSFQLQGLFHYSHGDNSMTALIRAVFHNHKDVAQALIAARADVNVLFSVHERRQMSTVLMYAISKGYVEIVKMLIAAGANINEPDEYGYTALMRVVSSDLYRDQIADEELVRALVAAGANVNFVNRHGNTVLNTAVHRGNIEIVQALLKAGANVYAEDRRGNTALNTAAHKGNIEIIEELIRVGVNVNNADASGATALMFAAQNDEKRYKDIQRTVDLLIGLGANVHVQNNIGKTALMFAAKSGQYLAIDSLVAAGADVNIQDLTGKSAFMYAVMSDRKKIVQKLMGCGANVDLKDRQGQTALMLSFNDEIPNLLITAGANVNDQDADGDSVLLKAVMDNRGRNEKKNKNLNGFRCR